MKINELQPRQGRVELEATVIKKGQAREFKKETNSGKVCTVRVKDDTGEIDVTLWNDQIDLVDEGDTIRIANGYVGEWQGEKQLSTGKFGTLEVVQKVPKHETGKHQKKLGEQQETDEEKDMPEDIADTEDGEEIADDISIEEEKI